MLQNGTRNKGNGAVLIISQLWLTRLDQTESVLPRLKILTLKSN